MEHTKQFIEHVEKKMAKRLDISLKDYKDLVHDEFYTFGEHAVDLEAADKVVEVKCGASLKGVHKEKVQVFIFTFDMEFAECPLVATPLTTESPKDVPKEASLQFEKAKNVIKKTYYLRPITPKVNYAK